MKLSIIVVAFDMARELPRTLQSLMPDYQLDGNSTDYEVLVVDNGSPEPVPEASIRQCGPQFKPHYLNNPPSSPAYALNYGAARATGDIVGFVVDGAHLLTPGLLRKTTACFRAMTDAVVITRYFYLGPGPQNETILEGYNQAEEDRLLQNIDWPRAGYRLFEIGTPLVYKDFPNYTWFYRPLESNCLFMPRDTFLTMGGADERFDLPGGGFMNIDLFKRACDWPDSRPVMLIGEGSFHQVHGGTTTNVTPAEQTRRVATYLEQYRAIHGCDLQASKRRLSYFGDIPTPAADLQRFNKA